MGQQEKKKKMLATNVRAKKLAEIRREKVGAIITGVFMFGVFYLLTFL